MKALLYADRIFINGKIVTVDPQDSIVEAIAVKNGKFVAAGATNEVMNLAGNRTELIDLGGKMVLPGIIDTHTHPSALAAHQMELKCRQPKVKGIRDILELVKEQAERSEPGKWIIGAGFNDSKLTEKRHPTRWELDEAAPENPVFILADTGHQCITNSKAMEIAGVTRESPDPPGGEIHRDESGNPTGLFYEMAMMLISKVVPQYTVEEIKNSFRAVLDQFSEWGVTTTHDASGYNLAIRAYQQLLQEGVRQVRMRLMVSLFPKYPEGINLFEDMSDLGIESGFGNDWLQVMSLKIMGDGSGAGGTACVYEPQRRGPCDLGLMMTDPKIIEEMTIKAHEAGLRCSIHSIGDRGIDIALDCIEKAQNKKPVPDMRHRLEHNSCCTPKQLQRIKALGVTPSSSIGYMYGLGDQYLENFGPERSRWLHPQRTMKEMGIIAGGNNDCPVTFYGPFVQLYAAVTRKTSSGQVVGPEEAIDIMEAIRVYTWNGAYLGKDEDRLGSIEPGKLADFIVVDRDILEASPEELLDTTVLMTVVDGVTVFER